MDKRFWKWKDIKVDEQQKNYFRSQFHMLIPNKENLIKKGIQIMPIVNQNEEEKKILI